MAAFPRKGSSIRVRLTLGNVAVLAVVLALLGITVRYIAHAEAIASVDRELADRASLLRQGWSYHLAVPFAVHLLQASDSVRQPATANARRYQAGVDSRRRSMRYADPSVPTRFDLAGRPFPPIVRTIPWDWRAFNASVRGQEGYSTVHHEDETLRVYSVPLRRRGKVVGVLQIAEPLDEMERGLDGLSSALLIMAPLTVLIAGIVGAFLTDRALRPVRQVTYAADRIGAFNLAERLPVWGNDEFSQLACTINGMLGRLELAFLRREQSFEQQRRFTADVSHELRTPLTVIKAHTSLALSREASVEDYRHALLAADRAAGQMNRIVQDLLLLARSDAGQWHLRLRSIPMSHVLETIVESFAGQDHASIEICPVDAPVYVLGDHTHLVRLFTNLVENAVRYTPASGRIRLRVTGAEDRVITMVEDTGIGIPEEHLPHVCERFYRVDKARTRTCGGSGLGLSICQSIVEAHHGSLVLESTVGKGTTVRVILPRAAQRRARSARST